MSRLAIGTKVVVQGHVERGTWHLSNLTSGHGYPGKIVAYDKDGDYVVETVVKGRTRRQKVRA